MSGKSPYPAELRRRAVWMVAELRPDYPTEWATINAVAAKLGIGARGHPRERAIKIRTKAPNPGGQPES